MRAKLILLCLVEFAIGENNMKSRYGIIPKPGEFPFALCIEGDWRCSGSLVAPDKFMSAGHCFNGRRGRIDLKKFVAKMGVVDLRNKDDPLYQERKIVKYLLPDGFGRKPDKTRKNDIGAGYLDRPFDMSTTVGLAKIVSRDPEKFKKAWYEIVEKRDKCRGMGWGATFTDLPSNTTELSNELKYIWVIPLPDSKCIESEGNTSYHMCGKGEVLTQSVDPANDSLLGGDSGGPFVCGEYVYGVVASGRFDIIPIINKFVLFFPYLDFYQLGASNQNLILSNTYTMISLTIFLHF